MGSFCLAPRPPPRELLMTHVFPGSPSTPWRVHEPGQAQAILKEACLCCFRDVSQWKRASLLSRWGLH